MSVLAVIALVALALAVVLLVRLHLLSTGLSPARDAVSDYGTTRWHALYRGQAIALGVAGIALALGLARDTDASSLVWLWLYGGSRIAIAGFMTDRDPPPSTTEGRIHWLLAALAFPSIALAGANIDWSGAPNALDAVGTAVVVTAIATLVTRVVPPLRAIFGMAERALYVTSIAWLAIAAIDLR